MATQTRVLITGVTGQQGGAVARALLDKGYQVSGLTRDPASAKAQELRKLGIKMVRGDFDDPASLKQALGTQDAVFAVSVFFEKGVASEVAQGVTLAEAAKAAGIKHFVYTSVGSANHQTGIPHFESKWKVEQKIRELELPYTILRPVYFMENLYFPSAREGVQQGTYGAPLPPTRALQQVAVEDIGQFGALVIERPSQFMGTAIDLASDDLTGQAVAQHLGAWLQRPVRYFQVPLDAIRAMSEEMAVMYEWFDKVGYHVDVKGLRRRYPEVAWHDFPSWLAQQDRGAFSLPAQERPQPTAHL